MTPKLGKKLREGCLGKNELYVQREQGTFEEL